MKATFQNKTLTTAHSHAESRYEFSVVLKHNITDLKCYRSMLEELVTSVIEPNIFYEPFMLFPALESYATDNRMVFLLIMATDVQEGTRHLCGFFPMVARRFFRGLPLRNFMLWHYPHCYLATPLLHREFADQSLQALLTWFQTERRYSLVVLNQLSADGDFHKHLNGALAAFSVQTVGQIYERAIFYPGEDAATYLGNILSSKSRKEYRRLQRRLSERGDMTWGELTAADSVDAWINDFLQLESSGWKGRSGTALASTRQGKIFFGSIAADAYKCGRLLMLALRLDGRPVAMISIFLGGRGGYAFKMAYDEDYQYYAPGVLLILELFRRLHDRETIDWLDSCAVPDNALMNRLCPDRKPLCNVIIARPRTLGASVLKLLPVLSHLKKRFVPRLTGLT